MNTRRNPFESPEAVETLPAPPSIYESLRVAAPRKRGRQWERKHQSHKAVYRGVDPKLALQVKKIAGDLIVPEGEVARSIIEYSLRAHQEGDLELTPHLNPNRLRRTLFPESPPVRLHEQASRPHKPKPPEELWRVITTWRGFPPELKKQISELASDDGLNVPVGELVTALLRFGLRAYEYGLLTLEPVHKAAGFRLEIGDEK